MNILYIGGGFVGACSAAVSADSGHQTLVYDVDDNKMRLLGSNDRDTIEACIFEEGLGDLLIRNRERITFTSDYGQVEKFLDSCQAVFLCVPTPEIGETGESDLKFYFSASERLARSLAARSGGSQSNYVVIINKSTVPVEMIDQSAAIMDRSGVKNYGVVSNPEFLVEGKAIEGSIRPDRVVVGAWTEKNFLVMRELYQRFYSSATVKYLEVNPKEAAAGKLLANFCLFNKLAVCFDVIGRTAETFSGLSFETIRRILTTDPRLGNWGFYDSLYAGGSCFIKDARSLAHQLQTAGQNAALVQETYLGNKRQLELFLGRAEKDAGVVWQGKRVALLGLAFKQGTNDVRNSPSIDIVNFLLERAVGTVQLYDPVASENFKLLFSASPDLRYAASQEQALAEAEVVIIATDWPQFRGLTEYLLTRPPAYRPLILDGRRILNSRYGELAAAGYSIIAVGSPFIAA